jgi:hypothetical protein
LKASGNGCGPRSRRPHNMTLPPTGTPVLYTLPLGTPRAGETRPAWVTATFPMLGSVNLVVAKAHDNDLADWNGVTSGAGRDHAVALIGAVEYSAEEKPGTWRLA